ncbi:hypothetical protein [Salibacterium halotolerans]|uniref:Phage P2 baseplate assembly protein gpV n=1 Tax=Salibacterium halotolerans TaxID=1884432 RepID=A0A1I5MP97_9BACI|nr:hypothetical protein [Salibacterium halotolerans]SFP11444.1 Phage P2 baseplate assembly protein gpV [Salibacterium halotolerans]
MGQTSGNEALKIARNLVRVGEVSSVDDESGMVEVLFRDRDNMVSAPLPLLSFEYNMPVPGDSVACLFMGNGLENGFCIGKYYSEKNKPTEQDKNIYRKQLDDNVYVRYDKTQKDLKVIVDSVELKVQGGSVTVSAEEVQLGENAEDGIPLGKQLKQWLDNHTHPISWTNSGGSGDSSPPSTSSPSPSEKVKVE